jgi:hypothetical protein
MLQERRMPFPDARATVSTKGRVTLPKSVPEDTPEGVLLRPAAQFPETAIGEVCASLPSSGRPKTLEEMEAGILAEARRRNAES